MLSDQDKKLVVYFMQEAFSARLRSAAVSLCRADKDPKEMFSGTLLLASRRLFVITCAHAISSDPNGKIWVIREKGASTRKASRRSLRTSAIMPTGLMPRCWSWTHRC